MHAIGSGHFRFFLCLFAFDNIYIYTLVVNTEFLILPFDTPVPTPHCMLQLGAWKPVRLASVSGPAQSLWNDGDHESERELL